ncbi:nitrite reductase small subunit NirD [Paenibacillus xylaniclasticus]|uniref:nitrite reductase small subunit NirD n=1 Tax=Paenibacillus xylaniclasticus TaxID=588083 RepID=UPI000FDC9572|nr:MULTISPECIES: nitrite reductase small subunit NirD [Paenibacillus]GFN32756.1 assimilatory nitrite reductase [NAD(P)H] small subunit [Paenibacillus curdlanolyticus]
MKQFNIGHISEFPERRGKVVKIGGLELAMFNMGDGTIKAVENSCPHKQGKLSEGIVCDGHVYCPLHDWKISLTSGIVQAPDEGCVKTYNVTVEANDRVILHIDEAHLSVS